LCEIEADQYARDGDEKKEHSEIHADEMMEIERNPES
jgi:hypothetical protein